MSYLTNLKNEFSTAIRSRGQMYYHSDRVLVDSMAPGKEAETADFFTKSREPREVVKHKEENSLGRLPLWKRRLENLSQGTEKNQRKNIQIVLDSRSLNQSQRVGSDSL